MQDTPHSLNVVLLHGLLRTRFSMSTIGYALERRGARVHNIGYMTVTQPIESAARHVYSALERRGLLSQSLSFVTHSLGSLVLRSMLATYGSRMKLHRAVMLGPPNQGSQYAELLARIPGIPSLLGPSFRQIVKKELPPPATEHLDIGVIAGIAPNPFIPERSDGIVSISETALSNIRDWAEVGGWHSLLMYTPRVWDEVWRFLNEGRFSDSVKRHSLEEYDGSGSR